MPSSSSSLTSEHKSKRRINYYFLLKCMASLSIAALAIGSVIAASLLIATAGAFTASLISNPIIPIIIITCLAAAALLLVYIGIRTLVGKVYHSNFWAFPKCSSQNSSPESPTCSSSL